MGKGTTIGMGILAAFLLIASVIGLGSQSFSILAASEIKLGDKGLPVWVFTIAPSGEGETIAFYSPEPDNMGVYTDGVGGEFVPQQDFNVKFKPEPSTCTYALEQDLKLIDKIVNYFSGFFGGEKVLYYDVSENFQRKAPILVTTSKNPEGKYIDGFAPRTRISFEDERDDKGSLVVEAQGGLMGNVDCISTGGTLKVAQGQETGKLSYYFDEDSTGYRTVRDTFQKVYERCDVTNDKTQLVCEHGTVGIPGVGVITVTADAQFLDYRYYPPTQGEPKIITVEAQSEIEQNSYGSIRVEVQNEGKDAGTFTIEGLGDVTYAISVTSVTLEPGETKDVYMSIVAPKVDEEKSYSGQVRMCSTGQFGGSSCDTKGFSVKVVPGNVKTGACGDNICQTNENFNTCAKDCQQTITCEGNHMFIEDAACRCESGFSMTRDKLGRQYCEEDSVAYLIVIGIGLLIIGVMVVIKLRMDAAKNGSKRSGRRR